MRNSNTGYWLKDKTVYELNGRTHIGFILDNLKLFNITRKFIEEIYNKYNEKLAFEGKAREEIIQKLLTSSRWIKIRHYLKPTDYWSIQCGSVSKQKRVLHELMEFLVLEEEIMNINDSVVFLGFGDNSRLEYNFMKGGINKFLLENKQTKKHKSKIKVVIQKRPYTTSSISWEN